MPLGSGEEGLGKVGRRAWKLYMAGRCEVTSTDPEEQRSRQGNRRGQGPVGSRTSHKFYIGCWD